VAFTLSFTEFVPESDFEIRGGNATRKPNCFVSPIAQYTGYVLLYEFFFPAKTKSLLLF
jgi:hypothetical protein